jgi:hypothetical protein
MLLLKNHSCINILIDKPDVTISESTSTFSGTGGGSVNIPCS